MRRESSSLLDRARSADLMAEITQMLYEELPSLKKNWDALGVQRRSPKQEASFRSSGSFNRLKDLRLPDAPSAMFPETGKWQHHDFGNGIYLVKKANDRANLRTPPQGKRPARDDLKREDSTFPYDSSTTPSRIPSTHSLIPPRQASTMIVPTSIPTAKDPGTESARRRSSVTQNASTNPTNSTLRSRRKLSSVKPLEGAPIPDMPSPGESVSRKNSVGGAGKVGGNSPTTFDPSASFASGSGQFMDSTSTPNSGQQPIQKARSKSKLKSSTVSPSLTEPTSGVGGDAGVAKRASFVDDIGRPPHGTEKPPTPSSLLGQLQTYSSWYGDSPDSGANASGGGPRFLLPQDNQQTHSRRSSEHPTESGGGKGKYERRKSRFGKEETPTKIFSRAQYLRILQIMEAVDTDGDGFITLDQLLEYSTRAHLPIQIFKRVTLDEDGKISFPELIRCHYPRLGLREIREAIDVYTPQVQSDWRRKISEAARQEVAEIFERFDVRHKGYITLAELYSELNRGVNKDGFSFTHADLLLQFEQAGLDPTQSIGLYEFEELMKDELLLEQQHIMMAAQQAHSKNTLWSKLYPRSKCPTTFWTREESK